MNLPFRLILVSFIFVFTSEYVTAQVIKGTVQDAVTRASLPFANVFLNNTTKGTVTDEKGEFTLSVVNAPGNYELVVSYVGYESYKTKVSLSENETLSATVLLAPSQQALKDVEVKTTRDKVWEKQFKKFKKVFLGDDNLADSCKIINPWVIDFVQEKSGKLLAHASQPIEIDNNGIGYKLLFHLKYFWTDRSGYFIAGNVQFFEKESSNEEQVLQWQVNRKISYLRSRHHFFKAIIESRIQGEGFQLYSEKNAQEATTRSPIFSDDLGKIVFPYDTTGIVRPGNQKDTYVINLKGRIEVHFENYKQPVRTYRDVPYAVSWIRLSSNRVLVRKDGYEVVPADVTVSGDMSAARVSRMLPLDYRPTDIIPLKELDVEQLQPFREKIYVHTNKPYYYAGESLWYKGYIHYSNPLWRDSLSRTVYVELINREKEIVSSKILEIQEGTFSNDFMLPSALRKGTYFLRAYTNFNRNFGDSSLFVRPIHILSENDQPLSIEVANPYTGDSTFIVTADKGIYKPREKVTLTLFTADEDEVPISANISLAVTDGQVARLSKEYSIRHDFLAEEPGKGKKLELNYPIEYGFGFSGRFFNNSGTPEMTVLSGVELITWNLIFAQSDEKGLFNVGGLQHYDTAIFALKSEKATNKPYGRLEVLDREAASMQFELIEIDVPLQPGKSPQRNATEYEVPKNTRLLKEVQVKAKPIEEEEGYRAKRPYGRPDYVLTKKDINTAYGTLLQILPGRIPGLVVRQVHNDGEEPRWVVYLIRQGSILYPMEVQVTVNDVIVSGTPAQILGSIDPTTVETIEAKNGINVLYGSAGGSGVLAIYTKKGIDDKTTRDPNFQPLKIKGYSGARTFKYPDYGDPGTNQSQPDLRSTIYWNPEIITDPKTGTAEVSFYAADLEGKYRIVAEGVDQNGEPLHCEYFIEIKR